MNRRHWTVATIASLASALLGAAGCSSPPSSDEPVGSSEAAATPSDPSSSSFALAESCSRLFKRHESLRPIDLDQGLIRWGCGDVPGVTDPDLGQEYCEYQAVQNGKAVKKAADLTTGKVSCVFTSVFTGAGQAARLRPAMADAANLGVEAATDGIVQMQKSFNSRGAATTLISDCSRGPAATEATRRQRVVACFQAFARGGPNAARLQELCKTSTITDAAWTEAQSLGAKVAVAGEAGFEEQQDVVSCMSVRGAGVAWRNSDPMICARVSRSASECSCRFGAVPSALPGLPFSGWVDDHIPSSCRLAKVEGQDYPYVAICDLTDQEVSDLPLNASYARSIQNFCHDRFGVDIVMKLPLRSLQSASTCNNSAGFCAEYMGDAPPADPAAPEPRQTPEGGSRNSR